MEEKPDEKRIETTLEIAAPVEVVWKPRAAVEAFAGRWQIVLDRISQRA